jgi:NAD(P)H dehydrogenase (quinone)
MKVLYVYCHPLPESYHAAIRTEATGALAEAGHDVDLLDRYAEGFDPVLQAEARRHYHDPNRNQQGLSTSISPTSINAAASWPRSRQQWCAFERSALP